MTDQLMREIGKLQGAFEAHAEASKEWRDNLGGSLDHLNNRLGGIEGNLAAVDKEVSLVSAGVTQNKQLLEDHAGFHDAAFKRIRKLERWDLSQKSVGGAAVAFLGWVGWDKVKNFF